MPLDPQVLQEVEEVSCRHAALIHSLVLNQKVEAGASPMG